MSPHRPRPVADADGAVWARRCPCALVPSDEPCAFLLAMAKYVLRVACSGGANGRACRRGIKSCSCTSSATTFAASMPREPSLAPPPARLSCTRCGPVPSVRAYRVPRGHPAQTRDWQVRILDNTPKANLGRAQHEEHCSGENRRGGLGDESARGTRRLGHHARVLWQRPGVAEVCRKQVRRQPRLSRPLRWLAQVCV